MFRSRVLVAAAAPAVGLVLVLSGCQQAAEEAAEQAIENADPGVGDVEIDEDGVTVEGEDGSVSIQEGDELPEGWPSAVELPDGATLTNSMVVDSGGQAGWMVTATYDQAPSDVADAFSSSLTGAGFTEETTVTTGDQSLLGFSNDQYQVAVTVGAEGDGSVVSVTVSEA